MNKYYKQFRRGPNAAFFIVLGCIFVGLGVRRSSLWSAAPWAISALSSGRFWERAALFRVCRYGIRGNTVSYRKFGMPRKADVSEIGAAVICIYDEYRRGKGSRPSPFKRKTVRRTSPASFCSNR